MDLLEHLVDVGGVGLDTLLGALLVGGCCFLGCLGRSLLGGGLGHVGNKIKELLIGSVIRFYERLMKRRCLS